MLLIQENEKRRKGNLAEHCQQGTGRRDPVPSDLPGSPDGFRSGLGLKLFDHTQGGFGFHAGLLILFRVRQ